MATQKSFFGRSNEKKRGNPMFGGNPNATSPQGGMFGPGGGFAQNNPFAPKQPAAPAAQPKAPKPPEPTEANPFLGRIWNVQRMAPGAKKQAARQDLRNDRRAFNQRQQQADNAAFEEAEWLDNSGYDPLATPPNSPYANPGYDPSHGYGQAVNAFFQTGVGREWIKQNPEAYYGHVMAEQGHGYGDNTAYGRYVRDRADDELALYAIAQGQSPGLTLPQYMLRRLPQLEQEYRLRPFIQRGEIPLAGAGASWLGGFS